MTSDTETGASKPRDTFWQQWYAPLLLTLWVLIPELRRLVDWQVGFNSLPVINLVPIVALLPLVGVCFQWRHINFARDFMPVMWLWIAGFGYALLVGFLSGSLLGAAYEGALFGLPFLVGLWMAGMNQALAGRIYERFVTAAIWLGVLTSLYGIYQFISPTPWDIAWVIDSDLASIGNPEPFGLRIFGTMNSPGVLADFLAVTMLLSLHRLRARTIWLVIPLLFIAVALVLTFYRTAWLELVIGLAIYLILSPRRGVATATLAATAVLTVILATNLSLITGDPASNGQLMSRISTFNNLQTDDSANARSDESRIAIRQSLAEPLGQGLGTVGTATKLSQSASTTVLDNGYLTRFLEMGIFGFACYLLAVAAALLLAFMKLRAAYAAADDHAATILATCIAIQVALVGAELSGDQHYALTGVLFWVLVGFSATARSPRVAGVSAELSGAEPTIGRPLRA